MESRTKLLEHPIHQMLIMFPLGLLATAVVSDVIYLIWGNPTFATVAYWMIVAGIISGIIAAPFGTIDWLAIPSRMRAKSVGLWHGVGNVLVLLLFIGSWWLRRRRAGKTGNSGDHSFFRRRGRVSGNRLARRRIG